MTADSNTPDMNNIVLTNKIPGLVAVSSVVAVLNKNKCSFSKKVTISRLKLIVFYEIDWFKSNLDLLPDVCVHKHLKFIICEQ